MFEFITENKGKIVAAVAGVAAIAGAVYYREELTTKLSEFKLPRVNVPTVEVPTAG